MTPPSALSSGSFGFSYEAISRRTQLTRPNKVNSTYTYDSYGNLTASTGSLVNSFHYTGREFDSETNLYYYRARYYDSGAGRFVGEDPFRFRKSFNFFSYARNSPMTFVDPSGLCHVEMRFATLGAGLYAHAYLLVTDHNFTFYFRGGPEHGHSSGHSSGASSASSSGSSGSSSGGLGWGPMAGELLFHP